jgi:hypothetical protein
MKKLLIVALCAGFLMVSSLAVAGIAPFLNFENLYTGVDDLNQLPIDYAGFTWNADAYYITNGYVPGSGYDNIIDNVGMLIGFAAPVSMANTTPFDFKSATVIAAYDAASWGENNPQTLQVQGWNGATATYSQTLNYSDMLAHVVNFNFLNVDMVTFTPLDGSAQFVIDNINGSPVPVPPTVLLLGSGLVALVGLRRFRRN